MSRRVYPEPAVSAVAMSSDGKAIEVEVTTVVEVYDDGSAFSSTKQTLRVPLAFAKTLVDLATKPATVQGRYICIVCGDTATHVTSKFSTSTYWCEHHTSHPGAVGATRMPGGVPNDGEEKKP